MPVLQKRTFEAEKRCFFPAVVEVLFLLFYFSYTVTGDGIEQTLKSHFDVLTSLLLQVDSPHTEITAVVKL